LLLTWLMKSGPRPPPLPRETFTAMPMSRGTSPSATSRIWLRRRPKTRRSSLRSNRPVAPRRDRGAVSPGDIETLPGQLDEQVFQARPGHRQSLHTHFGGDQCDRDVLGCGVPEQRGGPSVVGLYVAQLQPV